MAADLSNGKIKQFFTAAIASTGGFIVGILLGWSNSVKQDVMAGKTGSPITENQFSWIASLLILGAAIFSTPSYYVMEIVGRRMTMLLLSLPITIGWLMLAFNSGFVVKCIARFMQGICVGAFNIGVPLYVSEITEKENRSSLLRLYFFMTNCGIFMVFLFGVSLNVINLTWLCTIFAVLYVIGFMTMPESPIYLVNQNRDADATDALKRLRSPDHNIESEIRRIREIEAQRVQKNAEISTELQRGYTIKPLILLILIIVCQQFSGYYVIILYSSSLFRESKISLQPHGVTVLLGLVMVFGGLFSTCMLHRFHRRMMFIFSGVLTAFSTMLVTVYFFEIFGKKSSANDWLPITSFCTFVTVYSFSYGPLPWVIIAEIFDPDIKDAIMSIMTTTQWITAFIVTKSYAPMKQNVGLTLTYSIYTLFTILGLVVGSLYLVETKNKTLDEIHAQLTTTAVASAPSTSTAAAEPTPTPTPAPKPNPRAK